MAHSETRRDVGAPGFRGLDLIGDPFALREGQSEDPAGVQLVVGAETLRAVAAIDGEAGLEKGRPVWIEKPDDVPDYYRIAVIADLMDTLTSSEHLGVLPLYIQLSAMKLGRIRSALGALAEHVVGHRFDLTLAAHIAAVLAEPDTSLAEHAAAADGLASLAEELSADPEAAVARIYGPLAAERFDGRPLDEVMRIAAARENRLDVDPTEADGEDELDATDPLVGVFIGEETVTSPVLVQPVAGDAEPAGEAGPGDQTETEDGADSTGQMANEATAEELRAHDLAAYIEAYTGAHLSPVVARALRVYRAKGTIAAGEELKVTKAPRKTLRALLTMTTRRYRKVLFIYDQFEMWQLVPDDLRTKIIASLAELRWIAESTGIVTILASAGDVPELAEQFAAAVRVDQHMLDGLRLVEAAPAERDTARLMERVLTAASLPGTDPKRIASLAERLAGLADGEDLAVTANRASTALREAAARGLGDLDEEAVAAARQA
jgi:hypothetical protein